MLYNYLITKKKMPSFLSDDDNDEVFRALLGTTCLLGTLFIISCLCYKYATCKENRERKERVKYGWV